MNGLTVGVDVGGTKVAAALVDAAGSIVRHTRTETDTSGYRSLVDGISQAVSRVAQADPIDGVGIAIAGNVASDGSSVLFSPHLPLAGEALAADLREAVRAPVLLENDANAAAWAEHEVGAGRGTSELLFIALGTGLGAGLVLRDRLYRGYLGFAGEAGHMTVVVDGRSCPCGARGCWERYASGTALEYEYAAQSGDSELSGPEITAAANDGEELARSVVSTIGEWVGRGLASLVAVLDPERIVVGGGLSEVGDLLLTPARQTFADSVTGAGRRPVPPIEGATLGNDAGVIGAAMLALHKQA